MEFPEQEVPLILIVFLGSLGSALLLFYRNFLCPKTSTAFVQKVYVGSSLLSIFLGVISVLNPNKTLFFFNWVLSGILLLYSIVALFLSSDYSLGMTTWSDVFLIGLSIAFFFMRAYASLLLTYDRAKQKPDSVGLIRPIPKPFDLYTIDQPNNGLGLGFGLKNRMPTII